MTPFERIPSAGMPVQGTTTTPGDLDARNFRRFRRESNDRIFGRHRVLDRKRRLFRGAFSLKGRKAQQHLAMGGVNVTSCGHIH